MFSKQFFSNDKDLPNGQSNRLLNEASTDDASYATVSRQHDPVVPLPASSEVTATLRNAIPEDNGNAPFSTESHEIATLMEQVNDNLERELKETKKAVKSIFKEIVAFHEVSKSVHELWAPILIAERQESLRLDELQAEVHGTIGAYSVPVNSFTNNNVESTGQHVSSK
jgi:hypothetical protein